MPRFKTPVPRNVAHTTMPVTTVTLPGADRQKVKFIRQYRAYNNGMVATFSAAQAQVLFNARVAVPVDASGAPTAPQIAPPVGENLTQNENDGIDIPDDWDAKTTDGRDKYHHLKKLAWAKRLRPDEPVKTQADAESIIREELAVRSGDAPPTEPTPAPEGSPVVLSDPAS